MFENLKKKWGIENSFQLTIVFIVFAITGSVAAKISDPISAYFNLDDLPGLIYWPIIFGILVSIFTFKKDKFIFNFFLKMSILFTKKLIKFLSFGIFYKN